MPEIKHNFTGGKMNKDLDERLIKSGEYRDAMNIQVTTSEGSDVGTMQNVLGNSALVLGDFIPNDSYTVGSISDEKNDTLYWLVAGGAFSVLQQHLYDPKSNTYSASAEVGDTLYSKDLIVRKTKNSIEPVFVDIFGLAIANTESVLGDGNATQGPNNTVVVEDETLLSQIEVGMTMQGLDDTLTPNTDIVNVLGVGAINEIDTVYTPNTYSCQTNILANGFSIDSDNSALGGFELEYGFSNWSYGDGDPPTPNGNILIHIDAVRAINANIVTTFGNNPGVSGGMRVGDQIRISNTAAGGIIFQNAIITGIEVVTLGGEEWRRIIHDTPPNWSTSGGGPIMTSSTWAGDWTTPGYGMVNGALQGVDVSLGDLWGFPNGTQVFTPGTTISVFRDSTCFHPYVDLSNNSSWLDEIYNAFFDDDGSYIQNSEVRLKANLSWADTGGGYAGCIDWETTYDASSGYALNGPTTTRLHIANCDDFTILVKPLSSHNYLNLVASNDGFIENVVWLDSELDFGTNTAYFNFQRDRVLNFKADRLITGINLVDDMLFWTDGYTEPKKINISRSLMGTHNQGQTHTRVVADTTVSNTPAREEHVTVIRKSPIRPLDMELSTGREPGVTHTGVMTISTNSSPGLSSFLGSDETSATAQHYDFSSLGVGDFCKVEISEDIFGSDTFTLRQIDGSEWKSGTKVVLKEFDENEGPDIPILQYTIKATIGGGSNSKMEATTGDPAVVTFRIDFIEGNIPATDNVLKFAIDFFDETEKLFEFKFPRFSYRYRYADGEYSTFAPFTEVAFIPGSFNYHPRKGYNLGMTNSIKAVTIKNFITPLTPADVVAIDILYKDDQSPNIYVVDTIKPNDEVVDGSNEWQANEYKINSDIIHAVLPANQLLRPWDNVPRKALAQEITKNRLVYANYTQGYDLTIGGENIKPQFKHSLIETKNSIRSIKSLREYQLGVVFVDKYGRETPVITNRSGGFKIGKNESANKNQLKVGFDTVSVPEGMEYSKFFIKETSGEYYNMAMDRWYDGEDGGVWLAFPSSDRNKLDEDTFLILKKGVESSNLVKEPARYKVLAIENQAPDFIKTTKYNIGDVKHDDGSGDEENYLYGEGMDDAPKKGRNNFTCKASRFNGTSLSKIEDIKDELYVEFYIKGKPNVSHRYKINSVARDVSEDGVSAGDNFSFVIDGFFNDDVNFIFNGPINSPSSVKAEARTRFYKGVLENGAKFDGKFFVKIYADEHFDNYIANPPVTDDNRIEYSGVDSKKIYYCSPNHHSIHAGDFGSEAVAFGSIDFIHDQLASLHVSGNAAPNNPSPPPGLGLTFDSSQKRLWAKSGEFAFRKTLQLLHKSTTMPWWQNGSIGGKTAYEPGAATANRAFFKNDITNIWNDNYGRSIIDESGWDSYGGNTSPENYGVGLVWDLQNDLHFRDDGGPHGYKDVFFIDGGPRAGTNGSFDDGLRHNAYGGEDLNHGSRKLGKGIQNFDSYGFIDLGFGPIMPEQEYPKSPRWTWDHTWTTDKSAFLNWRHHDLDIFNFNDSSRYEDEGKYLNRLASGKKFHWLDDPTKTIYTLEQATTRKTRSRTTGEGSITTLKPENGDWTVAEKAVNFGNLASRLYHPLYYTGENFTKNGRAKFAPAMTNWEPTNLEHGGVGPINGGRNISEHAQITNGFLQSTAIISIANSWTNNSFKVSKLHIEQAFDSANGTIDLDSGTVAGEFTSVTEGMILTHVGDALITSITDSDGKFLSTPLLIQSITEDGDSYIIEFTGYSNVKSTTDNDFGLGTATNGLNGTDSGVHDLIFRQPAMNGLSVNSVKNLNRESFSSSENWIGLGAVGYALEFLEPVERDTLLPKKPAVWETEPKESTDLNIYYEISGKNPLYLNKDSIKLAIPIGSTISVNKPVDPGTITPTVIGYPSIGKGKSILLDTPICVYGMGFWPVGCPEGSIPIDFHLTDNTIIVTRPDGGEMTVSAVDWVEIYNNPGMSRAIILKEDISKSSYTLNWSNCFSFGNGVESNRIRDTFNLPYITNGVKASTTLEGKYKEEHRKYGLIYSGIYNSTSGINNLNQFIQAEKITKDVNPVYGSIQKLHTRDSNLIALCEDKILKILAHKDALYNADGNPQLIATDKVLGQTTPFIGEYGISTNPESFASESYRAYFTDKVRGAVMRLSKDGLTPISDAGMRDWFRDNLKLNNKLVGSYDDYKSEYNLTLTQTADKIKSKSITYREDVRGWVSFKSFVPENGLSCANQYYTFKGGMLYRHHVEKDDPFGGSTTRNNFYKVFTPSSFNVIFNDQPGIVKLFKTINYEGSQSKVDKNLQDGQYYNLNSKKGWYVEHIETDLEKGSLNEFIEKEGKWFNYIKGKNGAITQDGIVVSDFNNSDTSFQGIGRISGSPTVSSAFGCIDITALNYDSNAVVDDGSCVSMILGCMDALASNFDSAANTDDGLCIYPGCVDVAAFNYDSNANQNDGSCIAVVNGCTDITMFNYDDTATTDDGGCVEITLGCIDNTADNYNDQANIDDGGCFWYVYGCTDVNACNYDGAANTDDGTCGYCGDAAADNYSAGVDAGCVDDCLFCGFHDSSFVYYTNVLDATDTTMEISWNTSGMPGLAATDHFEVRYSISGANNWTVINNVPNTNSSSTPHNTYTIQNLQQETNYDIQVRSICSNTASEWSAVVSILTLTTLVYGCTDPSSCNQDVLANTDDNSCEYTTCAGCMDPTFLGYDATATINDLFQCGFPIVLGCTDATAFNYDVNSNVDDGSCIPFIYGCMDASSCNWDATANNDDGSCFGGCGSYVDFVNISGGFINDAVLGVYNTQVTVVWQTNTDPDASTSHRVKYKKHNESNWTVITGLSAGAGNYEISSVFEESTDYNFAIKAICTGTGCAESWSSTTTINIGASYGCIDASATNYNANATTDDNSCVYPTIGCVYGLALNYDPNATTVNLSLCTWGTTAGPGCTDPSQFNYDDNATTDDGSCTPFLFGCMDSTASNYNGSANLPGSCSWVGCTDPTAGNYDATATTDDGSCTY